MPTRPLPRASFDTSQVAAENRFDAWRDIIGRTHDIVGVNDGFRARVNSTSFGEMIVSDMSSAPQSVSRSQQRVRRDGLDHIVLHLTSADFDVESGDARFHVPAHSITVNTLSRPFWRSAAVENGSIVVSLSRDLISSVLPDPELFHGQQLREGFGQLLSAHMQTLAKHAELVDSTEANGLALATAQLLAAGLEPTRRRLGDARNVLESATMIRCKRYIDLHLSSPELDAETICRHIGLSRATLFRLFQPSGGIRSYIRERRLSAARHALVASARPRISEIAASFGFQDGAAFSRAFRTAYGISPKDARERGIDAARVSNTFNAWITGIKGQARLF